MLDFLIDNIFVQLGGWVFKEIIAIPMGTALLADLFLYSIEADFPQDLIKKRKEVCPFGIFGFL